MHLPKSSFFLLAMAVLTLLLAESAIEPSTLNAGEMMNTDLEKIESLRVRYEDALLRVEGVVSVSVGVCGDRPCLKIGTSEPVEAVRPRLPEGLLDGDVALEYIGDVRAQ